MTYNQRTVTVKLNRGEIIDLLIACNFVMDDVGEEDRKKWKDLHAKISEQLEAFDIKNGYGVFEK